MARNRTRESEKSIQKSNSEVVVKGRGNVLPKSDWHVEELFSNVNA